MYSIGLSMQLKPGSYEGYKEAHDNLVARNRKEHGRQQM